MNLMEKSDQKNLPKTKQNQQAKKTGLNNPLGKAIIIVIAIVAVVFGVNYMRYASSHISTDDAYLTADIITIAPQVSGTVQHVYVKDNQQVNAGQILAVLDDSTYKTAVMQAQANLDMAIAAAEASNVNVGLTDDTGNAQIQQSEAGVNQAENAVGSSEADVYRSVAVVGQASANAQSVKAAIASAKAQKKRADAAVESASAQIETAEADIRSANAELETASAVYTKAVNDNKRYQKLLADNVIGAQMGEQAAVGEQTAKSQLQKAQEHISSCKSALNSKKADLRAAKEQINAANATIEQAQAQYTAAVAGVSQAQAQLISSGKAVHQSEARHKQAQAQLSQANTAPKLLKMSEAAAHQASARVSQARAALEDAKLKLSYTRIIAPVSGIVNKKSVNEGILVQPGTPLMALVPPPSENIWVVANFKETQITNLKSGQEAKISVDGIPGKTFTAKVDSIASGTGATFALLPADNATGNFTKVVQRIPVKLVIDSKQQNIDRLHAGMSVTAVIATL